MRLLIQLFFVPLWLLATLPAAAGSLHYQASLADSSWDTSSSPLVCTLSHTVHRFGRAEFYQAAGYQVGFRFFADEVPIRKGTVKVTSRPPGWKHDQNERKIGKYTYQVDETPFRFRREISLRLLSELEQGMAPVFSFKDWGDGRDNVTAVLSGVRFLQAQAKFRRCLGQLIPYKYENASDHKIYFATAKYSLSAGEKRKLDRSVAYLLRDPSVKKVYVSGHADEVGTHAYNNELSEQRAIAIRNYLLEKKVPASKMVVRYFGKRKPAGNNNSESGRAKNRRVSVKLVRE